MRLPRLPLLRQLTLIQLFSVVFGIACLASAYVFVTRATFQKALRQERAKVELSLREQQSKWRTWKQVGLEQALSADLASHARVFSLSELKVVSAGEIPKNLSAQELVIPRQIETNSLVVYARLDPAHIEAAYVPYRSNLILLVLSGLLFCGVILFSARYIRKHIYLPFLEMRTVFESLNAGKPVTDTEIAASGEIREFILSLIELYKKLKENEKNAAMVAVAKQVAHDIRSPLSALDMILDTVAQLPEQKRLIIRGALARIRDIANGVLDRARKMAVESEVEFQNRQAHGTDQPLLQSIASLVEDIVAEKKILLQNQTAIQLSVEFTESAYGLFVQVQPVQFKIVLSNLINNALEAIAQSGEIRIRVSESRFHAEVSIEDSGKGIAPALLQILQNSQGASFGKSQGMGLGLSHAQSCMRQWKGHLEIESQQGKGTRVGLRLPITQPPAWFVSAIKVDAGTTVLILDDEASIHLVWQQRFNEAMQASDQAVQLEHFSDPPAFRHWMAQHSEQKNILVLCDYEFLGFKETGIQLMESLALVSQAILVTGRFDEPGIQVQCERLGLRLLPKGLGGSVPVEVTLRDEDPADAVLLELSRVQADKNLA